MADHDTHDHTGIPGCGAPADILDIPTAETDASLVLAPDGAGGVEFRPEAGGGSITYASAQLGSPVGLNTGGFTDILSLGSLAAGTWLFMASLQCADTVTAGYGVKIWDGTTVFGSGDVVIVAGNPQRLTLSIICVAVLGGSATVKASGITVANTGTIGSSTVTGSIAKASNLVGVKLA